MKDYNAKKLQQLAINEKISVYKELDDSTSIIHNELNKEFQFEKKGGRNRLYPTDTTFNLFLKQIISADQSCQEIVSYHCGEHAVKTKKLISSNTAAYCKARQRLSGEALKKTGVNLGQKVHNQIHSDWRWYGRNVKLVDGTTLSMPDTEENQLVYPQPGSQEPGLGFPLMRWVALICLGSGAIISAEMSPCIGKNTGETQSLRKMLKNLNKDDILIGDSYYCSYFMIYALQHYGVDAVFELHSSRTADFRAGKKLGNKDHIVTWYKPAKPDWMDEDDYDELFPDSIEIREIEIKKGKQKKVIATSLHDSGMYTKKDIGELYLMRWHIELDLRAIKDVMGMGILRCKTPEMVRKEVWMFIIAYNLIRYMMSCSAKLFKKMPRNLSFKAALQGVRTLIIGTLHQIEVRLSAVLVIISEHRVNNRPNRVEPRCVKRRPKPYRKLREPRRLARLRICMEQA